MKKYLPLLSLILLPLVTVCPARAATFVVTSLGDTGPGSLRAAITAANGIPGSTIVFDVAGSVVLSSPLPSIIQPLTIDGTTAPGFASAPVVGINCSNNAGLVIATGADGSTVRSISVNNSAAAGITIQASRVSLQGSYIGLKPDGTVSANLGDGVAILSTSSANVIGNNNPVSSITYANTSNTANFTIQPVSAWQGLRNFGTNANQYLICGTSAANGLLYTGPIAGGGTSYAVNYPGPSITSTSVYGPDNLTAGALRLVGSYKKSTDTTIYNHGFVWDGLTSQLPSGGNFRTIDYPGAKYQFTHSTMGGLAVGNADGPAIGGGTVLTGGEVAYIFNVVSNTFVSNIAYPNAKTTTAYGIWYNTGTRYTICGGYSPIVTNNLQGEGSPLTQGKAYLVDYDSSTGAFTNWTSFDYPLGPLGINFITHFEGISSADPGTYTLNADSIQAGSTNAAQGSWVTVRRNSDNTFGPGTWVNLNYPGGNGITSSNSVYGNQVVGVVIGSSTFSYQATINIGFQLSNVISGNHGNGISVTGSKGNIIAMNYIGTDTTGSSSAAFGNLQNGILLTAASSANLIGGQATGTNNPTGTKGTVTPVFQRPPQGNLISGNHGDGVLINGASLTNVLSGNFIGTTATGTAALGNLLDGVDVESSNGNSLIGCTLFQNPFVFYNVIGGNHGNGVRVNNSNAITVQANFLGMGADNTALVPNTGDGLLVSGSSANTQVGGVIPLGNVISGNTLNGIEVTNTASGFISFNTFGGIPAFKVTPAPNGADGILITSTGGNNTVRTCIISGNTGNGVEIGGNATGVQITDTSLGTNTNISGAIPNQGSGIVISGTAHGNTIGGFQPSIEPTVFASGNTGYGIAILGQANNNKIIHTIVGVGAGTFGAVPNQAGGIYLAAGTYATTIGGLAPPLANKIQYNVGNGLSIVSSKNNNVSGNNISSNTKGIYANGICTDTVIYHNTVLSNSNVNVDISTATGLIFTP
jgi:parallel beta-helix repeat protein